MTSNQSPPDAAQAFAEAGYYVLTIACPSCTKENRLVENGRPGAAAYTFGYNRSSIATEARYLCRFFDHLDTVLANVIARDAVVDLISTDDAVPAAIVAAAASHRRFRRFIFKDSFRFADVEDFAHPNFLPGALKLRDIPGMLAIANPEHVICLGTIADDIQKACENAVGSSANLEALAK